MFAHDTAQQPPARGDLSTAASKAQRTDGSGSGSINNGAETRGDFSSAPGTPDHIHALDPTADVPDNHAHLAAYPSSLPSIAKGERADCLPEFTRAAGGAVALDRRRHTTRASIFRVPKP